MVAIASKTAAGGAAHADAPRFEKVNWRKEPHLRKLYIMTIFLLIASATTGYDGMLANTCQQMDLFKRYFSNVFIWDPETETYRQDENLLGIMINMFNIGSIISFFFTPYAADIFGRKPTIMAGCLIMILGACISAFTNGYGSMSIQCFLTASYYLLHISSTNLGLQCGWLVASCWDSETRLPKCALLCFSPKSATLSTVVPSRPSTTASGTWAP
jgi:MFS family permease